MEVETVDGHNDEDEDDLFVVVSYVCATKQQSMIEDGKEPKIETTE
jgi:hypothetical protein